MRALLVASMALFVGLATPGAEAAEEGGCRAELVVTDPRGDVSGGYATVPQPDGTQALDVLGVAMRRSAEGLELEVELAADPRQNQDAYLYYWVGYHNEGDTDTGTPPTWTFQRTFTYDEIVVMYWIERKAYPVEWNATTLSFLVPWADFETEYAASWPLTIGSPRATTQGPYIVGPGTSLVVDAAAMWNDWASDSGGFVPLPECPPAPEADDRNGSGDSAAPHLVAVLAMLAAVATWTSRRAR